jgi:hypothetical protein
MAVENLAVKRLILHEVFKGRDDSGAVTPRYGGHLPICQPQQWKLFGSVW